MKNFYILILAMIGFVGQDKGRRRDRVRYCPVGDVLETRASLSQVPIALTMPGPSVSERGRPAASAEVVCMGGSDGSNPTGAPTSIRPAIGAIKSSQQDGGDSSVQAVALQPCGSGKLDPKDPGGIELGAVEADVGGLPSGGSAAR